jgi:sortase (surface protein transpeptidase)
VNRSRPVHLSIPQIGVSVALTTLGLNSDGTVSVPSDYATPGWFKDGPTPGETGSAVILGHVDNQNGPAVFYHLDRLGVGSRVFVTLYNGRRLEFAVIGVRMFSKTNFPSKLVYGYRPYPALQLVTCGGVFDANTGHYLSNIVVFTALVRS